MADGTDGVTSSVLAILGLLANNASPQEFDALIGRAVSADPSAAVSLDEARRLALSVSEQIGRYRQREADFSALVDTAREFALIGDVDALLKMITRRTRLLLAVDMAYISLPDGDSIYIRTADGHTSVLSVGLRLPGNGGLGNEALVSASPFWTSDYLNDQRIRHSPAIDEVVESEGLRSIMAVPMFNENKPFGALYAASRSVRRFTSDEVSTMTSLGDLAAVAIERAQLQERSDGEIRQLRERSTAAEAVTGRGREFAQAHVRTMELVIEGADLRTVLSETHQRLGGALRLCAANSDVLVALGELPAADLDALTGAMVQAQSAREPVRLRDGLWTMPLRAGNRHLGALLARPRQEPGELELDLMQIAAHAATTFLLLDDRAGAADDQLRDELLDDLLAQPQRPPQQLLKRALRMGVDLAKPHVVVLARSADDVLGKVSVWASSYSHRCGGLKTLHRGCVVLLVPGADPDTAVRAVFDSVTASLREPVTVSASSAVADAASVLHGYREAVRCLEAMTALGMTDRPSSARQLGFLGILLSDHHDVDGFVRSVLGPVLDYDRLRSTELTRTLRAYFEEGASPTYAAKKLHVHANTVARRLERITELLGPDWQQPAQALEVQLALRLNAVRTVLPPPSDPATGASIVDIVEGPDQLA